MSLAVAPAAQDVTLLPRLGARLEGTTVSGVSSGAYMAGQFHLAHPAFVTGAALVAGGPYACAESPWSAFAAEGVAVLNFAYAVQHCLAPALAGPPDAGALAARARALAREHRIGDLAALRRSRVYLFSGAADRIAGPRLSTAAAAVYAALGVPQDHIREVRSSRAGHGLLSLDDGGPCGSNAPPFILRCGYDQAGAILEFLLGPLLPPGAAEKSRLFAFAQAPFIEDREAAGLAATGFVYLPQACQDTPGCRLHVVFHGCTQGGGETGRDFAERSGFNRWAERNRLIVLFPQAASAPANPYGCWDWWGYTGREFLTRDAPQIQAVARMVAWLSGHGRRVP